MKLSIVSKMLLGAALVATGFLTAQALRTDLLAQEEIRRRVPYEDPAVLAERRAVRFEGDVNGMYLAPEGTPVPEEYTTYEDICGSRRSVNVSWDRAGELDLTLHLPPRYILEENDADTGVVACGDTVFAARRTYTMGAARVSIGRSIFTNDEVDVAVNRPKAAYIAGRDVVVIEPITEDGSGQHAYAWFPETFGDTYLHAVDLPRKEFNLLVELLASSTRYHQGD